MTSLITTTMTDGELQVFANQVKEALFSSLQKEKVIKDGEKLSETYAVVIHRRGWLGSLVDRLWGVKEKDSARLAIVRVL